MGMAKRDEGKKVNSDINVTPMVDVMLVLLIIFMVVTPMLNNKVNVDLPVVTAASVMENANKEDAINVAVTRDGSYYVGGDKVAKSALGQKVADLEAKKTNPGDDHSVYFRADTRANYGAVMDGIDGLRTGGVSQLNLLTDSVNENH